MLVAIDSYSILAIFRKVSPEILQFWIRFLYGIFFCIALLQQVMFDDTGVHQGQGNCTLQLVVSLDMLIFECLFFILKCELVLSDVL